LVWPHVHGERALSSSTVPGVIGSSPRAWGTRDSVVALDSLPRFIPTCMGNAADRIAAAVARAVHPHVHGERTNFRPAGVKGIGSSPRAWGTHELQAGRGEGDRFIPTCMGNAG